MPELNQDKDIEHRRAVLTLKKSQKIEVFIMPAKKPTPPTPDGFNASQFEQIAEWLEAKYPSASLDTRLSIAAQIYASTMQPDLAYWLDEINSKLAAMRDSLYLLQRSNRKEEGEDWR